MRTSFEVPGRAVPKGRPRFSRGHVFTPKKTLDYEAHVAKHAVFPEGWPLDADYAVEISIYYDTNVIGDIDNICKALLDGLNGHGGAWGDDKQVFKLVAERRWLDKDSPFGPCVGVEIEALPRTYAGGVPPKPKKVRAPAPKKPRKRKTRVIKPRTVRARKKLQTKEAAP